MFALIVIIFAALILPGLIVKLRSFFSGRKGRPLFQHVRDVKTELGKDCVYSKTSSYITTFAAPIDFATSVVAMLCIPLGTHQSLISFQGDIIFMFYMLSLGKIMMALVAVDSASAFGGIGASRELFFNMLCEPAFMILMSTLCMVTGTWSFSELFATFGGDTFNLLVLSVLVGYGIFRLSLVENSRVPVDDPTTHLELTMIHEAQVLDLSGFDMALVRMSTWIKSAIWCMLCVNTFIPYNIPIYWEVLLFLVAVLVYAFLVAFVESFRARSPLTRVPIYILSISAIGILALIAGYAIINVVS